MKVVIALLLLMPATLGAQGAPAKTREPFFGPDKVQHFFVSMFLQSFTYSALRATKANHQSSLIGATVVSASFGIGKEVRDQKKVGLFSAKDLLWDAGGIGAATLLISHARR